MMLYQEKKKKSVKVNLISIIYADIVVKSVKPWDIFMVQQWIIQHGYKHYFCPYYYC